VLVISIFVSAKIKKIDHKYYYNMHAYNPIFPTKEAGKLWYYEKNR
jgi:hypothetical protein